MKRLAITVVASGLLLTGLLSACSTGPVRRVSEPTANIQQLTVRADGSWSVDLRIENFSSIPMRFDNIALALAVGGEAAGTLQAQPALSIGPEAADVATMTLQPSAQARIVIADTLARGRSIGYTLEGTLLAAPEKAGTRTFKLKRDNTLNPVPGLAGVLR
jgi:hypothetical protein